MSNSPPPKARQVEPGDPRYQPSETESGEDLGIDARPNGTGSDGTTTGEDPPRQPIEVERSVGRFPSMWEILSRLWELAPPELVPMLFAIAAFIAAVSYGIRVFLDMSAQIRNKRSSQKSKCIFELNELGNDLQQYEISLSQSSFRHAAVEDAKGV